MLLYFLGYNPPGKKKVVVSRHFLLARDVRSIAHYRRPLETPLSGTIPTMTTELGGDRTSDLRPEALHTEGARRGPLVPLFWGKTLPPLLGGCSLSRQLPAKTPGDIYLGKVG
jgi:hypothetical protein